MKRGGREDTRRKEAMEDGVGGRNDTLLSMGLLQIRIAATYISRLGLGYAGFEEVSTGHRV